MEHDRFETVNQCIREAAKQAAATGGLAVPTIERFLRTSEETWDGAGSGRFTPAQFKNNEAYRRGRKSPCEPCSTYWLICFPQKPNWSRG
jgi:hypothetical protein